MVAEQEKSVAEEERKAERDKIIGDTIYAHFNELQAFADLLLKANAQGSDWNDIIAQVMAAKKAGKAPAVYVEGFDGKNLALNLFMDDLHFSLNLRHSLFENANEYYEKGKKAKQKIAGALSALLDSKKNLAKLKRTLRKQRNSKASSPQKSWKHLRSAKSRWKTRNGTKNSAGSSAPKAFLWLQAKIVVSNEVLIKKYAKQEDVVFHAEITGAPSSLSKQRANQ